jgi:hypothetical protein
MKRFILVILMTMASGEVWAAQNEIGSQVSPNAGNSESWLFKALPNLCVNFDFFSSIANDVNKQSVSQHDPSYVSNADISFNEGFNANFNGHGVSGGKHSLKSKIKQYVYQAFNDQLNVDIASYTNVKATSYLRFEIEPKFSIRGQFEEVTVKAIMFE